MAALAATSHRDDATVRMPPQHGTPRTLQPQSSMHANPTGHTPQHLWLL